MGGFIRALRKQRRHSQKNTAAAAGVSQPYLSLIENNRATASEDQLAGIAGLLGVPARMLIRLYPRDGRSGMERGNLDDASDDRAAVELARVYRCGSCGTRPSSAEARALVDALAELRSMAAAAQGARHDPEALTRLWGEAQERLDVIAVLVDAGEG